MQLFLFVAVLKLYGVGHAGLVLGLKKNHKKVQLYALIHSSIFWKEDFQIGRPFLGIF